MDSGPAVPEVKFPFLLLVSSFLLSLNTVLLCDHYSRLMAETGKAARVHLRFNAIQNLPATYL